MSVRRSGEAGDTKERTMMTAASASGRAPGRIARLRARWEPGPWSGDATMVTVVTIVLVVVGLVMSFSAAIVDDAEAGQLFATFRRQAQWAVLGGILFCVAARLDHRIWRRAAWPMLVVTLVGLVLLLVPGVGATRYGSTRWLALGPLSIQPSELAKLSLLLWTADVLERKRPPDDRLQTTDHLLVPALPAFLLVAGLVLLQPDLGTTILLGLILFAVLWVEGLRPKILLILTGVALAAAAVLAVTVAYRLDRIRGWLWPERFPLDEGFQLLQSRFALGSGGWLGVGLGSSRAKWNFLPNPETDFIFAIIGEEAGLVGATLVVALFSVLLFVGLRIAYAAQDGFGRTVALAVTAWIVGQALINIGTVTGLLPITGVTLPLVSVGGSSLVSTLVALGILVAIARRRTEPTLRRLEPEGRR